MQRPQRILHRTLWLILAPVFLAVLVIALLNRPEWPVMDTLPDVEFNSHPAR